MKRADDRQKGKMATMNTSTDNIENLSASDLYEIIRQNQTISDAADVFLEAEINGQILLSMTRSDVADLLPGPSHFLLRRELNKFIQANTISENVSTIQEVGGSPVLAQRPNFSIYADSSLMKCNRDGIIDKETKDRCVRAVISNMIAATQEVSQRFPTSYEVEEMAKAMCDKYPVLKDDKDLNPHKPWEGFLYKLKRRLSNKKPVKKAQGPTATKVKKQLEMPPKDISEVAEQSQIDQNPPPELIDSVSKDYDAKVMAEHYKQLKKMLSEKNPNDNVVKQLLDAEFPARRQYVYSLAGNKEKIQNVVQPYPCFLKAVHVVEELRRYVEPCNNLYLMQCGTRLETLIEQLYLYGIRLGLITPSQTKAQREKAVLNSLVTMFPAKKTGSGGILTVLENEDTNSFVANRKEPSIILTPSNLIVSANGQVFALLKADSFARAVFVLLGLHYTFLLPYPKGFESVMTLLQLNVLKDNVHSQDLTKEFKASLKKLNNFLGC